MRAIGIRSAGAAAPASQPLISLGIDAAWVPRNPSGVALAIELGERFKLIAVASSFERFAAHAGNELSDNRAKGVLEAATKLGGRSPNIIAIDMPLSNQPIVGRRTSDDLISKAYCGHKCGTHSPSPERPGPCGLALQRGLEAEGYHPATAEVLENCLIEVYPHPALIELLGTDERLKYKAQKTRSYWPGEALAVRKEKLAAVWDLIIEALDWEVAGTREMLDPIIAEGRLKAAEDAIDAIICAWVGLKASRDQAMPRGDEVSAIWVPRPRT